jgi:hypothetical protein
MTTVRIHRWGVGLAAIAAVLLVATGARADIPKKVQAKFRGQILITDEPLPEEVETKEGVKLYKKLDKKALKGEDVDGVMSWTFFYTAFLKKPPKTSDLTLDFHTADKEKLYVANKRLQVNGNITIISGKITITEDDGPNRNRTYHLILRAKRGSKEIEIAKTKLKLQ